MGPYPRSRGATKRRLVDMLLSRGLSPLTRGNLQPWRALCLAAGPIPAPCRAYPRSRGATRGWQAVHLLRGAYPRSRGASAACATFSQGVMPPMRPIPARAGQPPYCHTPPRQCRAYPRSRGATAWGGSPCSACRGLSPLARGNRLTVLHGACGGGPIPARAGQPQSWRHRPSWNGAYPRSRGATKCMPDISHARLGLSPLARGNLTDKGIQIAGEGPIPARAGQP